MSAEASTSIGGVWARLEGQVIDGQFPLHRFLGSSEHSGVFVTESVRLAPSQAALKLVSISAARAESQLARWRALAGAISHPHLVRLFDVGRCHIAGVDNLYAVMEYADQDLAQLLQRRALTEDEAREMLAPVLSALAFLHERKLVLGRMKPANVLVVGDQLKLASDAIRVVGEVDDVKALSVYDPPEARDGVGTTASDVWALGVTLCEALTRRQPLGLLSGAGAVVLPPDLPPAFRDLVASCLRRQPQDRPDVAQIDAWLSGPAAVGLSAVGASTVGAPAVDAPVSARVSAAVPSVAPPTHAASSTSSTTTVDFELAAGLMAPTASTAATAATVAPIGPAHEPAVSRAAAAASPTAAAGPTPAHVPSAQTSAPAAPKALPSAFGAVSAASAAPMNAPIAPKSVPAAVSAAPIARQPLPGPTSAAPVTREPVPAATSAAPVTRTPLTVTEYVAPVASKPVSVSAMASAPPIAPKPASAAPSVAKAAVPPLKPLPAESKSTPAPSPARRAKSDASDAATPPSHRSPIVLALGVVVVIGVVWAGIRLFGSKPTSPPTVAAVGESRPAASDADRASIPPTTVAPPAPSLPAAQVSAKTKSPAATPAGASSAGINEVLPDVPPRAKRTIRGHVRVSVRVIVEQDGAVFAALAEQRGPSRYFERLAIDAAKKWTFPAAEAPAQRLMLVKFDFTRDGTTAQAVTLN